MIANTKIEVIKYHHSNSIHESFFAKNSTTNSTNIYKEI